jgi:hypothetical protein
LIAISQIEAADTYTISADSSMARAVALRCRLAVTDQMKT